ncbi:MAG: lysine 2,3-aminomutase [Candidatus Cloacimonas sp. SDB]|nr:MAG: lysine 2,3-aminomutase [Candidatus Cloacimonas sp. SDB]
MYWKKNLKKNITTIEELNKFISFDRKDVKTLRKVIKRHPMSISRSYLSLIDPADPDDPLRKIVVPSKYEMNILGSYDTSGEKHNTKFLGFQHKYPQTVLILSTQQCASYCRFCFRKRLVGISKKEIFNNLDRAVNYIKEHPEVNNILISGGDPLVLSNRVLRNFLEIFSSLPQLDFIRFGTKVPVYHPERIAQDEELLEILEQHNHKKQIYFVLQIDHPREISSELIEAVQCLKKIGIIINNQTVLLKGVNDDPEVMAKLQNQITSIGINPYYVFQCRPVKRVKKHFQIPVYEGYRIIEKAKTKLNGHSKRFRYVMSHKTGKIEILGPINDKMIFKYHQAKEARDQGKMFVRKLSKTAGWLDEFPAVKN